MRRLFVRSAGKAGLGTTLDRIGSQVIPRRAAVSRRRLTLAPRHSTGNKRATSAGNASEGVNGIGRSAVAGQTSTDGFEAGRGSATRRGAHGQRKRLTHLTRPLLIRQLRLGSGLVLFAYVSSHLIKPFSWPHLPRGDGGDDRFASFRAFWTGILGTILLGGAFAIHFGLALWALWRRRTLHMPGPRRPCGARSASPSLSCSRDTFWRPSLACGSMERVLPISWLFSTSGI